MPVQAPGPAPRDALKNSWSAALNAPYLSFGQRTLLATAVPEKIASACTTQQYWTGYGDATWDVVRQMDYQKQAEAMGITVFDVADMRRCDALESYRNEQELLDTANCINNSVQDWMALSPTIAPTTAHPAHPL